MPIRRSSFRCARRRRRGRRRGRSPTGAVTSCRSTAFRSRSRTTSTSRACRPRRPVRPSPTRPAPMRPRWRGCAQAGAIIIGKTNLDQFATGLVGVRSPYGDAAQPVRSEAHPGRLELGLGGRGRGRARAARARHRHGRLRPRAGGVSTTSSGSSRASASSRPTAWCRPAARSIACRCSRSPSTTRLRRCGRWPVLIPPIRSRRRGRSQRIGAMPQRVAARRAARRPAPVLRRSRCRPRPTRRRSRAWPGSAPPSSRSTSSRSTRRRGCSTRGPGWRSAISRRAR